MSEKTDLWESILAIQKMVTKVTKDGQNPHHKSKYPTLESVLDTLAEPLEKNDVIVNQITKWHPDAGSWVLETCIRKGKEEFTFSKPLLGLSNARNEMQALGSAETYARRYALMSFFKLAPTDDDAETIRQKVVKKMAFDVVKVIENFAKFDVTKEMIEETYGEMRKMSERERDELRGIYQALVDGAKPSEFFGG